MRDLMQYRFFHANEVQDLSDERLKQAIEGCQGHIEEFVARMASVSADLYQLQQELQSRSNERKETKRRELQPELDRLHAEREACVERDDIAGYDLAADQLNKLRQLVVQAGIV